MGEPLIDEDIRTARTLPSAWYTEMEHFKRLQSVFNGWQFAAHQSEFETNNVLPLEHIEAINGESMVLVKDEQTACYSNVCTHRGMRAALEACTAKKLQCRYHGRTFNLDGTLRHMPEFTEAIGFPTANISVENPDKIIPKEGVYTAQVNIANEWYLGMINIGTNPTVNGQQQSIELHIINWSGNVYDQRLQVALLDRVRDEVKFDSMADLQLQLEKDKDFILTAYKTLPL